MVVEVSSIGTGTSIYVVSQTPNWKRRGEKSRGPVVGGDFMKGELS